MQSEAAAKDCLPEGRISINRHTHDTYEIQHTAKQSHSSTGPSAPAEDVPEPADKMALGDMSRQQLVPKVFIERCANKPMQQPSESNS